MKMAEPHLLASSIARSTLNEREYRLLYDYVIKRAPQAIKTRTYSPDEFSTAFSIHDDYHAAATRSALRVFLTAGTGLASWDWISSKLLSKGKQPTTRPKTSLIRSPNFRLALSLASILYLHRLLYRFLVRLRLRLLAEKAQQLRKRYPHIIKALTSKYAPAIGASLAGFSLGIYPKDQLRVTIAIYIAARGLEFLYNAFEADGYFKNMPDWMGSWLLFPLAQGQLLHAFVFDRDCFPKPYGDFIMNHSPYYIQKKPSQVAANVNWPGTYDMVDALAEMARLNWPKFISPIILPNHPSPLPPTIDPAISLITSSAHPLLHSQPLSCAMLHPSTPSCLQAYLNHMLTSTPSLLRVFTLIFTALSLPRYKSFINAPFRSLNAVSKTIFKTTFIISSAIGVAWSSICLFQQILPRKLIPQWRFFLGGFLGGMFAYFDRSSGRATAIYAARTSADSLWKVGVKRRWWRGFKGGDLAIFVAGLATLGCILEKNPNAVGKGWEKFMLQVLKGEKELGLQVKQEEEPVTHIAAEGDTVANSTTKTDGEEDGEWQAVAGKNQE